MSAGEALVAGIVTAVGGVSVALAGWRAAGALVGIDVLDRSLAALTLGLGGLVVVLQVLGIAGLLSRWPVTVALVLMGAVVLAVVPRPLRPRAGAGEESRSGSFGREPTLVLAIAVALGALALILGLQGFSASTDTLQYHAPNAGTWLHSHSLLTLPVAVPGYPTNAYPSDHTLTALWLMLGTGSDQIAYTVNVMWGALAVLGCAALSRALGGRAWAGALLGLGVVIAPVTFSTQTNSFLSDLAAAAGVVAGAAAAVRALQERRKWQWASVAGVAIGLAAGSKYTAFLPAAYIVAMPLLAAGRRGAARAAMTLAAAAPLVLFWLIRNAADFGNPLYPLQLGPLHGLTSPLTTFQTPIASHLLHGHWSIVSHWLTMLVRIVGFAALLPLASGVIGVIALTRKRARLLAVAAGLVGAAVLGYLITPYTGGGMAGVGFLMGSQLRYALPALFVAAPVVAAVCGRWTWVVAAPLFVFGAIKLHQGLGVRQDLHVTTTRALLAVVLSAVFTALVLTPRLTAIVRRRPAAATAILTAVLVAGSAVAAHRVSTRPPTATERLLAQLCPSGRVGVLQVTDLRAVMGQDFEIPLVSLDRPARSGRQPILTVAALDRRIAQAQPALIVETPGLTQPSGWHGPPGWRAVGHIGSATLLASSTPARCRREI